MSKYLQGVEDWNKLLANIDKVTDRSLTAIIKPTAVSIRNEARRLAPARPKSGKLRKGIGVWAEKRKKGKKIYQLAFNKHMKNVFVKYAKHKKDKKGNAERYYYPASMEYGFVHYISKRKINPPKMHFMQKAGKFRRKEIESEITEKLVGLLKTFEKN